MPRGRLKKKKKKVRGNKSYWEGDICFECLALTSHFRDWEHEVRIFSF